LSANADKPQQVCNKALMQAGAKGYWVYQRSSRFARPLGHQWQTFEHRGIRFFIGDTRTERQARPASGDPLTPRIMSCRQHIGLLAWLRRDRARPAFVATPAMLLPRRRSSTRSLRAAIHSDAWDGYPGSLHALLAFLWREDLSKVVFLSGDEHLSCVVRATVSDIPHTRSVTVHSVHSSGLYAPYPFANADEADLAGAGDSWDFEDPDAALAPHLPRPRYNCCVEFLRWVPGDGYACLRLGRDLTLGWTLAVDFDRADGASVAVELRLGG
jgi:hypothetical protein